MKSNLHTALTALIVSLAVSVTAFADVKIKIRQKISGQTMENAVLIKGKRQRPESNGGSLISLMECDLRRDVQINPASETYQISPFDVSGTNDNLTVQNLKSKIQNQTGGLIKMLVSSKDTGERKQVFGYPARHIITTSVNSERDCEMVCSFS